MVMQIDISQKTKHEISTIVSDLVGMLRVTKALESEGLVLVCDDLELVLGDFNSRSIQNLVLANELCLDFAPMVYELVGYLAPEYDFRAVSSIRADSGICRVIQVKGQQRIPLFAVNMIPVIFDGFLRDIDSSKPVDFAPTFELMSVAPNSKFHFMGDEICVGDLNLQNVITYELSRLASITEFLTGHLRNEQIPSKSSITESLGQYLSYYREQPLDEFAELISRARAFFILGTALFLSVKNVNVLIGHSAPGIIDNFVSSIRTKSLVFQTLEIGKFHKHSEAFKVSQPYYESHESFPFAIDIHNLTDVFSYSIFTLAKTPQQINQEK